MAKGCFQRSCLTIPWEREPTRVDTQTIVESALVDSAGRSHVSKVVRDSVALPAGNFHDVEAWRVASFAVCLGQKDGGSGSEWRAGPYSGHRAWRSVTLWEVTDEELARTSADRRRIYAY
jgi:hypothetical protein